MMIHARVAVLLLQVYDMISSGVRGCVLVINNYQFNHRSLKDRQGWRADSRMLQNLFKDFLQFDYDEVRNRTSQVRDFWDVDPGVKTTWSLTIQCPFIMHFTQEMRADVVEFLANPRTHNACCTVLVVLSHGKNDGVYGSDGLLVSIRNDLIHPFNRDNARHLILKPKLFIIQACRGGKCCVPVLTVSVIITHASSMRKTQ